MFLGFYRIYWFGKTDAATADGAANRGNGSMNNLKPVGKKNEK